MIKTPPALRRLFAGAAVLAALSGAACASNPPADASVAAEAMAMTMVPAASTPAAGEPALWVVRDADSTVYLFGTFHALRDATKWRTPKVDAALKTSSELWLELADVGDPKAEAAMAPLIQRLGLDLARPLSSKLSAAENARLGEVAKSVGLNPAQLEPMRPWLAAVQMQLLPLMKAGYDPKLGVDTLLAAAARGEGKPIKGFETTEQQLRFFADLPPALEKQMLLATLEDVDGGPALIDRMSDAWARGDLRSLETELVADMRQDTPEFYRVVITDRNAAWAKAIAERMQGSGTSFVAVGAAHLVGPDSVQARLAQLGIRAERR